MSTPLSKFLVSREQDQDATIWHRSQPLSASKLRETLAMFGEVRHHYEERNVAVSSDETLVLAWLLFLLDGVAKSILLVPSGIDKETCQSFLSLAGTELILTDTPSQFAHLELNVVPVGLNDDDQPTISPTRSGIRSHSNESAETRWILTTSGTTDVPKLVSHTLQSLSRSIKKEATCPMRWGLLYDLRRFAGLQVFLQSYYSGSCLLIPDRASELDVQFEFLAENHCNALSATPTLWRKLLMARWGDRLPLRQITLGGEIADDAVLGMLKRTFPEARITHIYASTEAGVGFSVKSGRAGFPVEFLHSPPPGIEIAVNDDNHLLLRPARVDQYYLNSETRIDGADRWIDTGDIVERDGDRYLFLGRANGAINVGGDKVYPEEVEQFILRLEGVAECLVRGRRNSFMGMLIEAVVVPSCDEVDTKELVQRITAHCAGHLPRYMAPAIVAVQNRLPVSASGKYVRDQ